MESLGVLRFSVNSVFKIEAEKSAGILPDSQNEMNLIHQGAEKRHETNRENLKGKTIHEDPSADYAD